MLLGLRCCRLRSAASIGSVGQEDAALALDSSIEVPLQRLGVRIVMGAVVGCAEQATAGERIDKVLA